ncbi:phosphoglucosamine mutase [Candidatus Bathyarchaeota archaeon]|nr:phosphoglucosamine mutase [Candidatus Bathyarchaeota archaeon]
MTKLFGSNGVRGVVNKDFTIELASCIAASAGSLLGKDMAVGRDGRTTSPMFRDAVVSALLSVGCNVHDFGVITTPSLQYMIKCSDLMGGVMVTASHNPSNFNGVKIMYHDGVEIPKALEAEIECLVDKGGPPKCEWDQVGKVSYHDYVEAYTDAVISHVDSEAIRKAGLSVALDLGNGAAVYTAPVLASKLGCKVYTLNAEVDGGFPGRGSEPTPENLTDLKELIRATKADLGIGFDGDGDRSIIIDENSDAVWGDKTLSLVAQEYLKTHPGETIVTAISSSPSLEKVVAKYGGKVYWTKVGSVLVSRAMIDNNYLLGGEENGGIMYGPFLAARDGCMALALMLHYMATREKPLSELIAEQPQLYKDKDKTPCPDELKEDALKQLAAQVDAPEINTMDGVKLVYGDGSWVLFRPSGTEPIFRIYAESSSAERVRELIEDHKVLVKKVVDRLSAA